MPHKSEDMSRLNITIPTELHRQIKAAASLQGKSLKEYILERVLPQEGEVEDVNATLIDGLQEVADHKSGKSRLPTYQEFIASA